MPDPAPDRLVVIDTQSVFDWLVFGDPACAAWPARLAAGWRWIHSAPMRAEFDHIAGLGFGPRWPVPAADVLDGAWSRHAHRLEAPAPVPPARQLRCTDPDDQKFIDLAIAAGAAALVTRDKALLRLARRARERHGVLICRPVDWRD